MARPGCGSPRLDALTRALIDLGRDHSQLVFTIEHRDHQRRARPEQRDHAGHCIAHAIESGDVEAQKVKMDELIGLLAKHYRL